MTGSALTLVLLAALLHASWNILAKRAATQGTITFVWLCSVVSLIIYGPVVLIASLFIDFRPLNTLSAAVILGTGILHLAYFILLQRGYRVGDLSLVYPLARGSGPLFTVVAAILFLHERPSVAALSGIALIICGIFVAVGLRLRGVHHAARSVQYGLATGATIAAYTLWDKYAVSAMALSPILYDFGRNLAQTALLSPLALSGGRSPSETWRAARWEIIGVAILSPLAYILVLFALIDTSVSLVAPVREVSIVIGAFLGACYLAEGDLTRRLIAATLMFIGIIAIASG